MENRRQSRHAATRVAAAVAQEAICTLMSSSADHDFETTLQSYANIYTNKSNRTASKRDAHGVPTNGEVKQESGVKSDTHRGNANGGRSQSTMIANQTKDTMLEAYQVWALKTYGDSAKTKTVTRKKYNRIMKILKGEESTNVENSKFRFWVKAKGFRIGPPDDPRYSIDGPVVTDQELYVPCSKSTGPERDEAIYKKVAVVENFYDIIYNVHVEMDGRSGKHAGQKRTYKAVAEMYAFLPREAVTRFLMSCSDCQKRMHLQGTNTRNGGTNSSSKSNTSRSPVRSQHAPSNGSPNGGPKTTLDIDYSLPLTTTIKRMRNAGFVYNVMGDSLIAPNCIDGQDIDEEMISETGASDADNNCDRSGAHSDDALCEEITADIEEDEDDDDEEEEVPDGDGEYDEDAVPLDMSRVKCESAVYFDQPLNMSSKRAKLNGISGKTMSSTGGVNSQCNGTGGGHSYNSRWNNIAQKIHDDDDEDDDEDNDLQMGDRILSDHSGGYDPERLKAFNMFVRLFVDENLDRMVPISRQPKEKIQAIIESCTRQFPEFGERARKRIRTYLKSCRRTKRHKSAASSETNRGWNDSSGSVKSPASNHIYHLASPMAEQILATACDNECQNAKRMRMGLKPIAVNLTEVSNGSTNPNPTLPISSNTPNCNPTSTSASAVQVFQQNNTNSNLLSFPYQQNNTSDTGGAIVNGSSSIHSNSNSKSTGSGGGNHYSLNPSEVAAVKQLIAGYRESAAFLLRSADELEQLILQQN